MTACAAKAECRRLGVDACAAFARDAAGRTAFVARGALRRRLEAPGDAVLFVAAYGARDGDFLRAALAAWDAAGRVQTVASHAIDAAREGWPPQGAPPEFRANRTAPHYSRDGGLPVARGLRRRARAAVVRATAAAGTTGPRCTRSSGSTGTGSWASSTRASARAKPRARIAPNASASCTSTATGRRCCTRR